MARNIPELPFTELVERVSQITRLTSDNDLSRVRGALNDHYVRELPYKEDWSFFLASSAITTEPQYDTGTVSVNTLGNSVTFSSDVVMDATFTGRKIQFTQADNIYTLTFVNTTSATISPPLSGTQNITNGAYQIFQPIYFLAPDFQRFPKNGGLQVFQGGMIRVIKEEAIQPYYNEYTPSPSIPDRCRVLSAGTNNVLRVELQPPPVDPMALPYDYLRQPAPLRESTAGFVTVAAGATTVTGSAGTTRFTEMNTGAYFRVDAFGKGADSMWYRVTAIANDSSLTISPAFTNSGATTTRYALSASPEMPPVLHPFMMYGAAKMLMADQNDPILQLMGSQMTANLQDAKRLYKTRIYNQQVETIAEDWQYRR